MRGGRYTKRRLAKLVPCLVDAGRAGIELSSWDPAGFAFIGMPEELRD